MTGILIENNLRIYFYSISMDYISVFMSGPHCFDYGSFILSFEMRKICSSFPNLFFLSNCSDEFHMNLIGEKQFFSTNDTVWWKRLFSDAELDTHMQMNKVQPLPYIVYKKCFQIDQILYLHLNTEIKL